MFYMDAQDLLRKPTSHWSQHLCKWNLTGKWLFSYLEVFSKIWWAIWQALSLLHLCSASSVHSLTYQCGWTASEHTHESLKNSLPTEVRNKHSIVKTMTKIHNIQELLTTPEARDDSAQLAGTAHRLGSPSLTNTPESFQLRVKESQMCLLISELLLFNISLMSWISPSQRLKELLPSTPTHCHLHLPFYFEDLWRDLSICLKLQAAHFCLKLWMPNTQVQSYFLEVIFIWCWE